MVRFLKTLAIDWANQKGHLVTAFQCALRRQPSVSRGRRRAKGATFSAVRRHMEWMLPTSSRLMSRKVLAFVVILVVTGLAPATAVLGFCAKMPCCFTGADHDGGPVIGADMADCCTTINCYEAPPNDSTASAKAQAVTAEAPAVLPVLTVVPARPAVQHVFVDLSPPRTMSDRLASLSVLLI